MKIEKYLNYLTITLIFLIGFLLGLADISIIFYILVYYIFQIVLFVSLIVFGYYLIKKEKGDKINEKII